MWRRKASTGIGQGMMMRVCLRPTRNRKIQMGLAEGGGQPQQGYRVQQRRGFRLDPNFVAPYFNRKAPFGFNGLGELVYYRTYARVKEDGSRESWAETVERVVNGTFSMQERWIKNSVLVWDEAEAQAAAKEMYERIFTMKFLPPGRGLWAMGTAVTEERGLFAALNNCAFVSTKDIAKGPADPFCFTMDASMLGVGVGFDTAGAGQIKVDKPDPDRCSRKTFVIPDSREGWVESLRELLLSYFPSSKHSTEQNYVEFDYSLVRPEGAPIRGFGGVSSGPRPLKELHEQVRKTLDRLDGKPITITAIVDLMNLIGKCVVSGNVRRTAEIAFGDAESLEYIELKNYKVNPHRAEFGWTSNNSVFARLGMDYSAIVERVCLNGEPGFAWLDNMRRYGRMNGQEDNRDYRAAGGNPCLEQTLEPYELCCLVETFPDKHDSLEDFLRTLESAFLFAKTVTLGRTHWPESNRVMQRNRRIGCSMSGIAQFVAHRGMHSLKEWAEAGYDHVQAMDEKYSEWLAVPRSIKTTCVKPSGTVSLLAGATPGIHAPESRFYIRRVRLPANSELLVPLRQAGYPLEPCKTEPSKTMIVSVPVDSGKSLRTAKEISMWEQLSMAAFVQRHWADNQVSCTVTFDPETEGSSLAAALDIFQYQLKGISFLPRLPMGAYEQMPYEEITEERFRELNARIKPLDLSALYSGITTYETNAGGSADKYDTRELQGNEHHSRTDALNIDEGVALGAGTIHMPDSFCDTSGCGYDDYARNFVEKKN